MSPVECGERAGVLYAVLDRLQSTRGCVLCPRGFETSRSECGESDLQKTPGWSALAPLLNPKALAGRESRSTPPSSRKAKARPEGSMHL